MTSAPGSSLSVFGKRKPRWLRPSFTVTARPDVGAGTQRTSPPPIAAEQAAILGVTAVQSAAAVSTTAVRAATGFVGVKRTVTR